MKDIIYCPDCLKGYSECNCAPASPVLEDASGLKRHIGSLNEHVATLRARVAELERERDDKDETIDWLSDMLRTVNELHRAEFQARENAEAERAAAVKRGDWVQGELTECKGKLAHTRDWKRLAESFESERNIAQHDLAVARARIAELERERGWLAEMVRALQRWADTNITDYIPRLERERDAWKEAFDNELDGRQVLRDQYGAYETETFSQFIARLAAERAERDAARAERAKAERDAFWLGKERDEARRELEEVRGRLKKAADDVEHYGGWGWREIATTYRDIIAAIEPGGGE